MANSGNIVGKIESKTQFEWRIPDICTLIENTEKGHSILSPDFTFSDASFCLKLFPNSTDYPEFMSLYLNWKTPIERRQKSFEFSFGIVKSDGCVLHVHRRILDESRKYTDGCGIVKISVLLQKKSELAPDNAITFMFSLFHKIVDSTGSKIIEVIKPLINSAAEEAENKSEKISQEANSEKLQNKLKLKELDRLSENFKDIFADKETCDTTLKVKDKDYKVHKAVLMARSPVFAAAFKHNTSEKQTGVMTIPDCDPDSFQEFLQYLYTGILEEISYHSALNLYFTSDKYDVPELKEFCVKYLMQCLTVENVCEIVVIADKYDEIELFSSVQDFFNKHFSEIFETSQWENFMGRDRRLANKLLKGMSKVIIK